MEMNELLREIGRQVAIKSNEAKFTAFHTVEPIVNGEQVVPSR